MSELVASPWAQSAAALGLSFILSLAVALVYTHLDRGAAPSRAFAQALAVSGVVSGLIVLAIGDSIARGIGLVGALTVIRFRSTLKDPRDLIFAFAALATGVAAGSHAFFVAIFGTAAFLLGTTLVSLPWFAPREACDAILSLRTREEPGSLEALSRALQTECREFSLVRVRQAGAGGQEHAYHVTLKRPEGQVALVQAVERVRGVEDTMLVAFDQSPVM